jgi:hypothetical protein
MLCAWCNKTTPGYTVKINGVTWLFQGYCSRVCSIAAGFDLARSTDRKRILLINKMGWHRYVEKRIQDVQAWMQTEKYHDWLANKGLILTDDKKGWVVACKGAAQEHLKQRRRNNGST